MRLLFKITSDRSFYTGSALILTVVLTTLLAIVGVLFLMLTRIDNLASSAASDNIELGFAVDTAIAQICDQLVLDVPGIASQEYYDYPDANNAWLANLEPYQSDVNDYRWRQISDVTGYLTKRGFGTIDVNAKPLNLSTSEVVREYPEIKLDTNGKLTEQSADADGDGIADSKWVELPGITSSKGKPFYAAIRIIDNSAMLNVNTSFKFNPVPPTGANLELWNRSSQRSQLQIDLMALAGKSGSPATTADETALLEARANDGRDINPHDFAAYEQKIIWNFSGILDANNPFTPFDISDELEMRYRFCLNFRGQSRLETVWEPNVIWEQTVVHEQIMPYSGGTFGTFEDWCRKITQDLADDEPERRHLLTTCNMDRLTDPTGHKMLNINSANKEQLFQALVKVLKPPIMTSLADAEIAAAQMTVNILDYIDADSDMTLYPDPTDPDPNSFFYGFERPCIYISELAYSSIVDEYGVTHRSCAIELFKPYFEDDDPSSNEWQVLIVSGSSSVIIPIYWSGTRRFHVIRSEDPSVPLTVLFNDPQEPANLPIYERLVQSSTGCILDDNCRVLLQRIVSTQNGEIPVTIDWFAIPDGWIVNDGQSHSIQRDISTHKCIRSLWSGVGGAGTPTLGSANTYVDSSSEIVQAHPANKPFDNIGQLGMILRASGYYVRPGATAADLLLDLQDPTFTGVFQYLTVIDPCDYGLDPNETRIKGRINISTAPYFVIAQLPWIQYGDTVAFEKARAIVNYRNINGPYKSIIGLMQVPEMLKLASDGLDNRDSDIPRGPDLTDDTALDDFEERDLIFARISNLITVRSDTFTAYILVRLGAEGPQKRVIAVFDRSSVTSPTDNVKIIAVQPVPDPT